MARSDDPGDRRAQPRRSSHTSGAHSNKTVRDFRRSYRGRTADEPPRRHSATRALAQILASARNPKTLPLSVSQLSVGGAVAALMILILAVAILFSDPFGGAVLGPALPSSAFAVIAALGALAYVILNRTGQDR